MNGNIKVTLKYPQKIRTDRDTLIFFLLLITITNTKKKNQFHYFLFLLLKYDRRTECFILFCCDLRAEKYLIVF